MASKFKTTHSIPADFPDILKDFVREILRNQPPNIFSFGADYFRDMADNVGGGGMSEEDLVQYLTNLFVQSDGDGNGVLDKAEFKRLMQGADLGLSSKQIKLLYSQADINEDGTIEYREFIPACVELVISMQARSKLRHQKEEDEAEAEAMAEDYFFHGMSKDELEFMIREAFTQADKDQSGELDLKEFQAFLKDIPLNLTKREINMAMMEVDTNQDGKVSLEEFIPLFHVIMIELIKHSFLEVNREPSELASFLFGCCQEHDQEGSGFLPPNKLARAFRDADLGLTKFQIMTIVGEAKKGPKGIEYEAFILDTAVDMIHTIVNVEESMQYKRTQAWKQVQDAEDEAEHILGMSKDDFTKIMGAVFHQYDVDQSGVLDEQEFENAMRNSGIPFTEQQVLMLMAAADMNDDGGIQYGEFAEVAVQLMAYVAREETIQAEMENVEGLEDGGEVGEGEGEMEGGEREGGEGGGGGGGEEEEGA